MCFAPQRRALFRHLDVKKWSEHVVFFTILTWKCASRHNGAHFFASQLPKVVREWCVLYILTWKFASRHKRAFSTSQLPKVVRTWYSYISTWKCSSCHNCVHFFDISTSKSGLRPWVFDTFVLQMCFAPRRRARFQHLNFQKWSESGVFCTFWLGNLLRATMARFFNISTSKSGPHLVLVHFDLEMCFVPQLRALFRHLNFQEWSETMGFWHFCLANVLRATTACTFSTSQFPKVVGIWCVFYILTWKCVSRHIGVQLFISHLASWLRTRRFSEVTFRPSGAPNHWKNTVNREPFAHLHLLSSDFLHLLSSHSLTSPSWLFPPLLFHLCILSEVWLLNFLQLWITQTTTGIVVIVIIKNLTWSGVNLTWFGVSYLGLSGLTSPAPPTTFGPPRHLCWLVVAPAMLGCSMRGRMCVWPLQGSNAYPRKKQSISLI